MTKEEKQQYDALYYQKNREKILLRRKLAPKQVRTEKRKCWEREYYKRNKKQTIAQRGRRVERNRQFVREYKATLHCEDCGMTNPVCFDFHHPNNNKEHSISNLVSSGHKIELIQKELAKCICLCANCHRIRHHPNPTPQ